MPKGERLKLGSACINKLQKQLTLCPSLRSLVVSVDVKHYVYVWLTPVKLEQRGESTADRLAWWFWLKFKCKMPLYFLRPEERLGTAGKPRTATSTFTQLLSSEYGSDGDDVGCNFLECRVDISVALGTSGALAKLSSAAKYLPYTTKVALGTTEVSQSASQLQTISLKQQGGAGHFLGRCKLAHC